MDEKRRVSSTGKDSGRGSCEDMYQRDTLSQRCAARRSRRTLSEIRSSKGSSRCGYCTESCTVAKPAQAPPVHEQGGRDVISNQRRLGSACAHRGILIQDGRGQGCLSCGGGEESSSGGPLFLLGSVNGRHLWTPKPFKGLVDHQEARVRREERLGGQPASARVRVCYGIGVSALVYLARLES